MPMMPAPKMAHAPHNYNVHYHRGDASSDAQRTIIAKKSRSINIKRSPDALDDLSVSTNTEQIYEWATWRMHHRITSARQARSAVEPLRNVHSSDLLPRSFQQEATKDYTVHNGLAFADVEPDEGVFIMDL
jgi:hypothetical protein